MSKHGSRNLGGANGGWLLVVGLALAALTPAPARALMGYLNAFHTQYPDAVGSRIDQCGLCHTTPPQLNPYGSAFKSAGHTFASIEGLDSDGDGATNLAEISAHTFPGDPADTPAVPPSPTPTVTVLAPTATAPPATATPPPGTATPPTATPTGGAESCAGDCNADGVVTVAELLKAVNIALGNATVDACLPVDRNGNGAVTINELLLAVGSVLSGCP